MSKSTVRKLPPMSAVEFAVEHAVRRYLFGLMLVAGWLVALLPLIAAVWYLVLREGMPRPQDLQPVQWAALGVLAVAMLLAALSVFVNWSRRLLKDERPRGLGWFRLDGPVWTCLAGLIVVLVVTGLLAGAAAYAALEGPRLLEPGLAAAAQPASMAAAAMIGLLAIIVVLRLVARLPALALRNRDFGFTAAWRASRRNSLRYLAFLFWFVFAVAIAGGLAAGALYARQLLPDPWFSAAAIAVTVLVALWLVLLLMTAPLGLYRFFGEEKDFPEAT